MSLTETGYRHIALNAANKPIIADANFKLIQLVESQVANNWSAEDLHEQFPFLTMGQIYSALAYYWDYKEEIDREIKEGYEFAEAMRKAAEPWPLRERLKAEHRI